MSVAPFATALLTSILFVSILTLAVAVRDLQSTGRSVALGEDRYELLHDQHDRLEFLREERQMMLEELERQSWEREQLVESLGKTPAQLAEDLGRVREEHLKAQERVEELEQELYQLKKEQLEQERSGSDYRPREKSAQEGEMEAIEQHVEQSLERTGRTPEATKAAKRKAEELGVDLSQVEGLGANGRIRMEDVLNAATRRRNEDHS